MAKAGGKRRKAMPRPDWEPPIPGRRHVLNTWDDYMTLAQRIVGRFHDQFDLRHFEYEHPVRLQKKVPLRFKRPYRVRVAYTEWGDPTKPLVLCCGGVANTAMRFNYLANDLQQHFRVVCMDWVGRGMSAWLSDENDYCHATYVEQLRQLITHLDAGPVTILGSSLGGSVAIDVAARYPRLVTRMILNDIGPYIPVKRRKRRSETLARFYVFRDPADLLRRIGASQKNDGPISDDIRFNVTFHQTKWSSEDGGRIYRHDVRALQAYRREAQKSLEQWNLWNKIRCPVLLIHGMLSDALLPETIDRMKLRKPPFAVMHVPDTGHTPVLSDRNQTHFILDWLLGRGEAANEWTSLYAKLRDGSEKAAPAPRPVQAAATPAAPQN